MTKFTDAKTLKGWLHDGAEIALFDVREQGEYGEAHLFYAVPLPYSRLEIEAPRLAPRKSVRLVVYDEGQTLAMRAAARLADIGYTDVHVLEHGTRGWREAGFPLFAGVNVPSKTFGELVEQTCHTPSVTAAGLAAMVARGENLVIVDGRPLSEFAKMNIPGAVCCPNGELGYRIRDIAPDPATTIVINCAGRTRSITGAQTLINLGLPNPVLALENGTQGWYLEDFELQHGRSDRYPDRVSPPALKAAREASRSLAQRFAIQYVDAATASAWHAGSEHSVFLCDVRTPEEFARGSLSGAQHAPGGQLIQATDQYVGVRHARVVVFDDDGVRAPVVASWLQQLGHDAWVLNGGLDSGLALPVRGAELPALPAMTVAELAAALAGDRVRVLDLRASTKFRKAHIAGATWGIRPRIPAWATFEGRELVLVDDADGVAELAASEWGVSPSSLIRRLEGGFDAWVNAALPTESTADLPADAECIDYLFFVHDRHDGNKAAARRYLEWETGLLAQLDERELAAFAVGLGAPVEIHCDGGAEPYEPADHQRMGHSTK